MCVFKTLPFENHFVWNTLTEFVHNTNMCINLLQFYEDMILCKLKHSKYPQKLINKTNVITNWVDESKVTF